MVSALAGRLLALLSPTLMLQSKGIVTLRFRGYGDHALVTVLQERDGNTPQWAQSHHRTG